MTDRNTNQDHEELSRNENTPQDGVDRRTFLTVAAGTVAATSGVISACSSEAKAEKTPSAQPPAQPPKETPEAKAQPKQPQKQAKQETKPAEEPAKVEKVQDKAKKNTGKGRIVQVTHSAATKKIKKTDEAIVKQMVEKALTSFTGDKDAATAIGRFFKKEDVVGIKVNCLGSPYATVHPATAFAFADALHAYGIPKKNIYIYDQYGSRMRKAGFKPLRNAKNEPEDDYRVHNHDTLGYEKARTDHGGLHKGNKKRIGSQLPKLLNRLTAVLNLCCVKDHDLTGITGAMKNVSYGNVERVPIFHCTSKCNPVCQHDGKCNVSRIYKHEKMGGLVRLVACDALRVLYQGGPQDNMTYKKAHNALLISTDPVAVDRAILEIVDGYRKERGLKTIAKDQGGRRAPRFIKAASELGLGEHDLAKIKWEKINMG